MKTLQKLAVLGLLTLPVAAHATAIVESSAAPNISTTPIYQSNFGGGIDGGKDYSDNWGTPGQTFTTGASSLTMTALTTKGAGSYGGFDLNRYFVVSISQVNTGGTASSGSLTQVYQQVYDPFAPAAGDSYLTFTLDTPLTLSANTIYEYDIYTSDSADPNAHSANGGYYAFAKSSSDALAGGVAMQNGFGSGASRYSSPTGSINTVQADSDRTFYITAVPEPSSIAMLGLGLGGVVFFALRRRKTTV